MSMFRNLFHHNEEYVRETAIQLADIEDAFKMGELTVDEFNELADDIIDSNNIIEMTDDINRRQQLQQAADTFRSALSAITGRT